MLNEPITWGDYWLMEVGCPLAFVFVSIVLALLGFGEKKPKHCPECNADITMQEPHWKGCSQRNG